VASSWQGVERIVAVGDIHGDYEQFAGVLLSAGLIDPSGNWTGGKAHLVQTGDVVNRGPNSRQIMDLLMRLEKQAAAAGGAVHCLIGNHEAMDVYGDLRYVSPGEFAAFAGPNAEANRIADAGQPGNTVTAPARPELNQAEWAKDHPPGFEELRAAFSQQGVYGRWIRSHDAVVKIDRSLFVHAGLGPKYANWSLEQINDEVRKELDNLSLLHGGIVVDQDGPLWSEALAKGDEVQVQPLVDVLLKNFGVDRIVIGHTYADGAITPRFGGKVLMVDVGLSRAYDNVGKLACLEIERGQVYALHRGHRLELPASDTGVEMVRYLRQAADLDPKPSPLESRIEKMNSKR
jgi:hypothetical protein